MEKALDELMLYPDGNGFKLKGALSKKYNITSEQIILGNGSNDILELAARIFLKSDTTAIISQHAFAVYPLVTQATGATGIIVPAKNYGHDLDAMLDAITSETRIIFIANPNNPTGTFLPATDILNFLKYVPQNVLVILDEAYYEYLPDTSRFDTIKWLDDFPNLLITRTFSKIYGMAGIRIGYGLGHTQVIGLMNRIRQPFNVNSIGLAGALAAINDVGFVKRSYALNQAGMLQITSGLKEIGLTYIPSHGNFLSFKIENMKTSAIYQYLLQGGVIVRPISIYGMPEFLRVTIGLESENSKFLQLLKDAIKYN